MTPNDFNDLPGRSLGRVGPVRTENSDRSRTSAAERARELGALIDTRLPQAADQLNDDFELLKAHSEGLRTRLAAGIVYGALGTLVHTEAGLTDTF